MKVRRTCGGGENFTDERLKVIRSVLNHLGLSDAIYELHDHKGLLSVYWKIIPKDYDIQKINDVWGIFEEHYIHHYVGSYKLYKEFE